MSRIHAHRCIESSEVHNELLPIGNKLPATESQCRPLVELNNAGGDASEVWQRVLDEAPRDDGRPVVTARVVKKVVADVLDESAPDKDWPRALLNARQHCDETERVRFGLGIVVFNRISEHRVALELPFSRRRKPYPSLLLPPCLRVFRTQLRDSNQSQPPVRDFRHLHEGSRGHES